MTKNIDLNADLGEGGDQDAALMALASSVNIACGGHAGNRETIRRSVELALQAQVAIGAHPGYEDRENFGRDPKQISVGEVRSLTLRQLESILAVHPYLHHVKPHGALYNQANQDESIAAALVASIAELQPRAILYCPPRGALAKAAAENKLAVCAEGFVDRRYQSDGSLCPRTDSQALIDNLDEAIQQALRIATDQSVTTLIGTTIPLEAKTLCVHGDGPDALGLLRLTRSSLENAGFRIVAP